MAIFPYGDWIRYKRKALKLSQEDLADGICAESTLSRIENGLQQPSLSVLEALLERLGISDTFLDSYVSDQSFYLHELKFKTRQAFMGGNLEEAKKLLQKFEKNCTDTPVNKQFALLYHTIFYASEYTPQQMLERFERALKLTCPRYNLLSTPKILSHEEIIAMNDIANCYSLMGQYDTAIEIYYQLKRFYDLHTTNMEEILRTQPMILYNLSKVLGLRGRYDECIEICDLGIRIAQQTGRAYCLAGTLYNRAWSLEKRGQPNDHDLAQDYAMQAYQMARIMENEKSAALYRKFIQEHFPELIPFL